MNHTTAIFPSVSPSTHSGMGVNLWDGGGSFRVWAPNAIAVTVQMWCCKEQILEVPMKPDLQNPSYWSADVAGIVADLRYDFWIENKGGSPTNPGGNVFRVDAYARQVENVNDNAK